MFDNHLLWEIKYSNGIVSYLFGTMHVKDKAAFNLVEDLMPYIDNCEAYFGEINLDEASVQITAEDYLMPNMMSLEDLIPAHKLERMEQHLSSIAGFQLKPFYRFFPMITSNQIAESFMSADNELSLDSLLWLKAKEKGKNMQGVEDVKDQVQLMKALDIKHQTKMLVDISKNLSKYRREVVKLKKLYENQKILKLYKQSKQSLGPLKKSLLYERNLNMTKAIADHNSESAFYAVGAAHLAGRFGMLRELKNAGLKPKPVEIH